MTMRQRPHASGMPYDPVDGSGKSPPSGQGKDSGSSASEKREANSYIHNLLLATLFRFLGKIGFLWHTWCLSPRGARVSRSERVTMRDGHEITLRIYEPSPSSSSASAGSSSSSASAGPSSSSASARRGCVINFHGGGWTIGSATDDARWARWLLDAGYVCISVEYRLAPRRPWPTPVYDCIDATRHIITHAGQYGVDKEKVIMSGFSAGGSLAVTTALALAHPGELDPSTSSPSSAYSSSTPLPRATPLTEEPIPLRGVVTFYPVLDFSTPRPVKVSRSPRPEFLKPLPGWMTRMFDSSYLPTPGRVIDRAHPLISPLLAADTLLADFPGTHLCLCEADVLAQEGQDFADRLEGLGGDVVARWVKGARHGWDKPPHLVKQSVKDEYDAAVESIRRWCA